MPRPRVILYVCASADGRVTMGPHETMFDMLARPELYDLLIPVAEWSSFTERIKELHRPGMSLEGSNMVVDSRQPLVPLPAYAGDPAALFEDFLPPEIVNRPGRRTWTAVVDGRGRFRGGYTACEDDPATYMIHLTSRLAPPEYLAFLRERRIPYLVSGDSGVDLPAMMVKIRERLQVTTIITSSGGCLAGALIRQGLLDEINLLVSPLVIGGTETPVLFRSQELHWPDITPHRLKLLDCRKMENDRIWVRYVVSPE